MAGLTKAEINELVFKYIGVTEDGYLRGFSYSLHERFYAQYCDGFDVDVAAIRNKEKTTTRDTFLLILERAEPADQARIIRGTIANFPVDEAERAQKQPLAAKFLELASRLEGAVVPSPHHISTTATVQRALQDAETLLRSNGPVSAVDRVHTALHGHLLHLCREAGIATGDDPSVTYLWKLLIEQHPAIEMPEPRRDDVRQVLRSAAAIIDKVNTIRNRASTAHPNPLLIGEDEAWLVINVVRALLHYLDRKLNAVSTAPPGREVGAP